MQIVLSLAWTGSYVYLADRQFVYPSILRGLVRFSLFLVSTPFSPLFCL